MNIGNLSSEDVESIYSCLQAMYQVREIMGPDFHTVLGFEREELLTVIANWNSSVHLDDEAQRIVSKVLSSIIHFPHTRDWEVFLFTGKKISEIYLIECRFLEEQPKTRPARTQELALGLRTIGKFREPDSLSRHYSRVADRRLASILGFIDLSRNRTIHVVSFFTYGFMISNGDSETTAPYHDIVSTRIGLVDGERKFLIVKLLKEEVSIGKDSEGLDEVDLLRLKTFLDGVNKVKDLRKYFGHYV